jgi:hypothetical protein
MSHFTKAWKVTGCRPPTGSKHPERTIEKYCVYDEPHRDYLYTAAYGEKLVREAKAPARFERFFKVPAILKALTGESKLV